MEELSRIDTEQVMKGDSLLNLIKEKDETVVQMLRSLTKANEELISMEEVNRLFELKNMIISQKDVTKRTVAKQDTIVDPVNKKGFFKRLSEVFVPPKDSTKRAQQEIEYINDTVLQVYNPVEELQQQLEEITKQRTATYKRAVRNNERLREINRILTNRLDTLINAYEEEMVAQMQSEEEVHQDVHYRSGRAIAWIAMGAVLLSVIFLFIIWRDITRSNRYKRQLEEARARAEELLQAREKLMLTITHDFKAPLGSIIGYAELLSRLVKDEREQFYLNNMKSSSQHLLKLVNDLLDFHKLDLNKTEVNQVSFNPAQLFEEVRVSFELLAKQKGLRLELETDPALDDRYIGDPLRIRQIVNNLLSNAIKFTEKGKVSLITSCRELELIIQVKDTGKGMKQEDKERIFQEFTRLPGAQGEEGVGLGLSIVNKLVQLLEGTIKVESTEGKGSVFTVSIPLCPAAEGAEPKEQEDEKATLAVLEKPMKVLLIDDDKLQLDMTAAMLQQQGVTTVCCQQLEELIEQLRYDTFDILLTDVQMPAINGFDLLKLLRASNIQQAKHIPVVAVTARSEMSEADFVAHGFVARLNKPFSLKDLMQVLGKQIVREEKSSGNTTSEQTLDFTPLTAFSGGDPEAARSFILSFIVETQKNIERMKQALQQKDVNGIANMAHKLLPLFTLINATQLVPLLNELEASRDTPFTPEIKHKTQLVIEGVGNVLILAEQEVG
ncbi:response regulator [Bacteroides sp. 224]|nr:response regulator [Bacteroides sp. 224]